MLEIGLGTDKNIVTAVSSIFRQLIQPAIPNLKATTGQGLHKTDSGTALGLGTEGL